AELIGPGKIAYRRHGHTRTQRLVPNGADVGVDHLVHQRWRLITRTNRLKIEHINTVIEFKPVQFASFAPIVYFHPVPARSEWLPSCCVPAAHRAVSPGACIMNAPTDLPDLSHLWMPF